MISDDRGFTLIELLVVILIIGILAAIALPSMLRHRELAQDTSAKSDARQMLTQVEACGTTNQNYTNCTLTDLGATGLPTSASPGKGEVGIAIVDAGHYKVTAVSRSGGNFYIERQSLASAAIRTCDGGTVGCHAANASGNQW